MHKQIVAITFAASALVSGAVACSSSSSTGGSTSTTDSGAATDSGSTTNDSGSGTDASAGCVPVGAAGNSMGVGKYCATELDCANQTANLCATLGGDPTQDFCTFACTPVDGGTDPCGGGGAICDCQGGQCGCVPTSCQ